MQGAKEPGSQEDEREAIQPLLDLRRAMVQVGQYAPDHPEIASLDVRIAVSRDQREAAKPLDRRIQEAQAEVAKKTAGHLRAQKALESTAAAVAQA